jgi:hypothetical protein
MGIKAQSRLIAGAPDYEEGVWTPTLGVYGGGTDGAHTYSQQDGRYVRVGNLVWVTASVTLATKDVAMSGNATVKGLPFVNGSAGVGVALAVGSFVNVVIDAAAGYTVLTATVRNAADDIALREYGDNVPFTNLTAASFGNNSGVVVTGTYKTTPSGS